MSIDATSTLFCNSCQTPIKDGDAVYCQVCGRPHHTTCWNLTGHCATPDCHGIQAGPGHFSGVNLVPPPPPVLGGTGTGDTFIYEIGVSAAVTNGWNIFQRYMGVALLGFLVISGISAALSLFAQIPIFGLMASLASIIINPIMQGGQSIFTLNLVNNNNPQVGDVIAGFQNLGKWLGVYYLLSLVGVGGAIPLAGGGFLIYYGAGASQWSSSLQPVLIVLGSLLALAGFVLMIIFYIRWMFVFYLAADGYGIIESFKRSAEMTEGMRLRLFGISFVIGLVAGCGIIACGVGLLFTVPIAACASASLYIAVRNQRLGSLPV